MAMKWKDSRDVHILSTIHKNVQMIDLVDKYSGPQKKPNCVLDYNMGMLGVDRHDQVLASFPIMRKFVKGYKKFFFYICDMAILNSFILYKKSGFTRKQTYSNYRLEIAESLLSTVLMLQSNNNIKDNSNQELCFLKEDTNTRLEASH
jgi:hypothetical protein